MSKHGWETASEIFSATPSPVLTLNAIFILCALLLFSAGCRRFVPARSVSASSVPISKAQKSSPPAETQQVRPLPADASPQLVQLVNAAVDQPHFTTSYDASYVSIDYPGGDVPLDRGACTDVLIRAFRKAGVDLQKEVHEDMKANFGAYPKKWGLSATDSNIDHRRVQNLMTFFERKGKSVGVSTDSATYNPGDVVTWDLGNGQTHTGMVTNLWSTEAKRYLIVHNIGAGAQIEDVLFAWRVTGHYRYF
jgi:uncharacterized protein YijF (DUF1287 family)